MCADLRLREQIYAQWRAERAARRATRHVAAGPARGGIPAWLLKPGYAAPLAALALVIILAI